MSYWSKGFENNYSKLITCPLFGQILNTCLNDSNASFLPYFYIKTICWGRDLVFDAHVLGNESE